MRFMQHFILSISKIFNEELQEVLDETFHEIFDDALNVVVFDEAFKKMSCTNKIKNHQRLILVWIALHICTK